METYNYRTSKNSTGRLYPADITKTSNPSPTQKERQCLEILQNGQDCKEISYGCGKILKRERIHIDSLSHPTPMMHIHYDPEGDILEIRFGTPTTCYYKELDDDISQRIDEETGEIKGYMIFSLGKRGIVNFELPVEHSSPPSLKDAQRKAEKNS